MIFMHILCVLLLSRSHNSKRKKKSRIFFFFSSSFPVYLTLNHHVILIKISYSHAKRSPPSPAIVSAKHQPNERKKNTYTNLNAHTNGDQVRPPFGRNQKKKIIIFNSLILQFITEVQDYTYIRVSGYSVQRDEEKKNNSEINKYLLRKIEYNEYESVEICAQDCLIYVLTLNSRYYIYVRRM